MSRKHREIPWLDTRDGIFYVFWYDTQNKRTAKQSLRTEDSMEAQKRYAAFLSEGHEIFTDTAGLTVAQALDFYLVEHVRSHVIDQNRQERAIGFLKAWFNTTRLRDIDIPASREYAAARRSGQIKGQGRGRNGAGDSTIRRELNVLQAAAEHNRRWKRIARAEMPEIEMPQGAPTDPVGPDDWLTKEELALAVAKAQEAVWLAHARDDRPARLHDFIVLVYDSASRRKAVETMTVGQVDLGAGLVNLRNPSETALQRRSKKRRPMVPIGKAARAVYERRLPQARAMGVPWVLGAPCDMYQPFRRHMEAIGLGHKRNPHILRHSRATHLLMDGESIYDVARLLGDTVQTVESVYGHYSPEYLFDKSRRAER